jgi:predicted Zn-dependent protease
MKNKFIKWSTVGTLVLIVYSCARVPLTGRRQTKLLAESEMVAMSLTAYSAFLDTSKVVGSSPDKTTMVAVGQRISKAVEDYLKTTRDSAMVNNYQWEFNLVDEPTVNAWCMPGGKVVFYNGIMPICKTETGVAVVMGHEIAHAVARHGNERMSQGLLQQLGGIGLSIALSDKPAETQELFTLAYGAGTTLGVMLPFSRKHESEADYMGLIFMSMAGYDPNEAPKFWGRMDEMAGAERPPEFLSTHPNPERRVSDMKKSMPEALKYYNAYNANK